MVSHTSALFSATEMSTRGGFFDNTWDTSNSPSAPKASTSGTHAFGKPPPYDEGLRQSLHTDPDEGVDLEGDGQYRHTA